MALHVGAPEEGTYEMYTTTATDDRVISDGSKVVNAKGGGIARTHRTHAPFA